MRLQYILSLEPHSTTRSAFYPIIIFIIWFELVSLYSLFAFWIRALILSSHCFRTPDLKTVTALDMSDCVGIDSVKDALAVFC